MHVQIDSFGAAQRKCAADPNLPDASGEIKEWIHGGKLLTGQMKTLEEIASRYTMRFLRREDMKRL
jgi:hypothetical protein